MPTEKAPTIYSHSTLKAKLTRAIKSKNPQTVEQAAREAVKSWEAQGFWPDNWSDWQRALDDVYVPNSAPLLEDFIN